jgi:hypothetical protein
MGQKAPIANGEQSSEPAKAWDTRQFMREKPHDDAEGERTP